MVKHGEQEVFATEESRAGRISKRRSKIDVVSESVESPRDSHRRVNESRESSQYNERRAEKRHKDGKRDKKDKKEKKRSKHYNDDDPQRKSHRSRHQRESSNRNENELPSSREIDGSLINMVDSKSGLGGTKVHTGAETVKSTSSRAKGSRDHSRRKRDGREDGSKEEKRDRHKKKTSSRHRVNTQSEEASDGASINIKRSNKRGNENRAVTSDATSNVNS